jgi:hypothetical protein
MRLDPCDPNVAPESILRAYSLVACRQLEPSMASDPRYSLSATEEHLASVNRATDLCLRHLPGNSGASPLSPHIGPNPLAAHTTVTRRSGIVCRGRVAAFSAAVRLRWMVCCLGRRRRYLPINVRMNCANSRSPADSTIAQ